MDPLSGSRTGTPDLTLPLNKVVQGDALQVLRTFPDNSVSCCISSIPYWSLRNYSVPPSVWGGDTGCDHFFSNGFCKCGAWQGCLGEEPSPKQFVDNIVLVYREVRRVLHPRGTCWLNIGASYASYRDGKVVPQTISDGNQRNMPTENAVNRMRSVLEPIGIKNKDMVLTPYMLAVALQADGWWFRSDIIWEKASAMPGSMKDRPTTSHEYIFLLTKNDQYFYDWYGVREPVTGGAHPRGNGVHPKSAKPGSGIKANTSFSEAVSDLVDSRNLRTVWRINSEPSALDTHFATFPEALVARMLMAGSSEKGICPECGSPMERIVAPSPEYAEFLGKGYHDHENDAAAGNRQKKNKDAKKVNSSWVDKGWEKTCKHSFDKAVPAVVMDPFMGSGTSGIVAIKARRNFVGIELNKEYAEKAQERIDTEMAQGRLL